MKVPEGSEVVYEWVSRTLEVMAFRDGGKVVTCSAICPHMGARLEVKRAWRGTTVPAVSEAPDDCVFGRGRSHRAPRPRGGE
jgi:hypothetical protein